MNCEGCGKTLGGLEATMWTVCMPCTRARARTATVNHGRCTCGRRARLRPVEHLGRKWQACDRCLGAK
jgi:hypothetical protein